MKPLVRPPQSGDAEALASVLRLEDCLELVRGGDTRPPAEILADGVTRSPVCWTLLDTEGHPAAMYGATPDPEDSLVGIVWFLAGDNMYSIWRYILRHTRPYIEQMHEQFPLLHNWVDSENQVTRRWLRWSGFQELGELHLPHPFIHVARSVDV